MLILLCVLGDLSGVPEREGGKYEKLARLAGTIVG